MTLVEIDVSQFKDIRSLIDSTEKLIFHGDRIYQLACLANAAVEREVYPAIDGANRS